jgi:D-inositol-3-phosphate glycosyltransferase
MPSHYESFGMVALEAMACGTPVVASGVGGLSFLVQDGKTGFTVPDGDVSVLQSVLMKLLRDPKLKTELGKNAATFALQYDWKKITDSIINLYQRMLESA